MDAPVNTIKELIIYAARQGVILDADGRIQQVGPNCSCLPRLQLRQPEIAAYFRGRTYTLEQLIEITGCEL